MAQKEFKKAFKNQGPKFLQKILILNWKKVFFLMIPLSK